MTHRMKQQQEEGEGEEGEDTERIKLDLHSNTHSTSSSSPTSPPQPGLVVLSPVSKARLDLLADLILDLEDDGAVQLLQSFDAATLADLAKYRAGDKDGDPSTMDSDFSMLALACAYSVSAPLIALLAAKCPPLLLVPREYPYEGQSPLHTLVSKENVPAVEAILSQMDGCAKERLLKSSTITGRAEPVNATVMVGGLPLSVAALTFNLTLVDLLMEHGADLCGQNDGGDTVFHSLVRFSSLYPEKEAKAEEVMAGLHQRLKMVHEPRSVWLAENGQGLTALQLAAQCTRPLLFHFIVSLKGVYCDMDEHDGLFDSLLYDITDIDPMALRQVGGSSGSISGSIRLNRVDAARGALSVKQPPTLPPRPAAERVSIMDIIYETRNVDDAFKILDNHVVQRVIQEKWRRYQPLFVGWTVLHLAMMTWLTLYAVFKARVVSSHQTKKAAAELGNATTARGLVAVTEEAEDFVIGSAILSSLWAEGMLLYELVRLVRSRSLRRYVDSLLLHHNGFYRLQLIVFAVGLLVDALFLAFWYWLQTRPNDYCLIVALLVGWWFSAFFLRPWKKFSFFTVMVQEVLIGDMLRFSTIFIPQLLAFSVAMYMTFMPGDPLPEKPQPVPEEFRSVGRTMMTMFKLMLGLADVEVLYEAREAWLAVVLFVLYVLLTYSLLLNALIALMSNTCSIVSQNREKQWKLQRMSIVLFLQEALWSFPCLSTTGQPRHVVIEDLARNHTTTSTRFVMKISSVRGGDGGPVLQSAVKNLMEGEAGGMPEDPPTKTANDLHDLLAALNFQRKQKLQEKERPATPPLSSHPDGADTAPGNRLPASCDRSYLKIRNNLQKMSLRSRCLTAVTASPPRHDPGPAVAPAVAPAPRQLVNAVPEVHPIPQSSPKIVLLPSPCLITTLHPDQHNPLTRTPGLSQPQPQAGRERRADSRRPGTQARKRGQFRQRPDSATLEDRVRRRRGQLVRRRQAAAAPQSPAALTSRPPSASSSGAGHGVFPVEDSRIHMHTERQQ